MIKTQLFINKKTGEIVSQVPFTSIGDYEKLICDTCKESIYSGDRFVDDGIEINKYHHSHCY